MKMKDFFIKYPNVAVAFSGGVDSSYLLYSAMKYCKKVKAYYVKSVFQPQFELDDAVRMAEELNADMKIIDVDILANKDVASNPKNRCYFCKKQIFSSIISEAEKDGFSVLLDGTNASDDYNDRPGMVAIRELSVLSPLRICGLTKNDIRTLSKDANLFTWNKPAYACLATRMETDCTITESSLKRTENAENYLSSIGFSDFRIRTINDSAKIQIRESQLNLLMKYRKDILLKLSTDYETVLLDLEVRNE